jgi:hypothetical protein
MEVFNIAFRLLFHAFFIWTFIWAFSRNNYVKPYPNDKTDVIMCRIVRALGLICILLIGFSCFTFSEDLTINPAMVSRAFGEYWLGFWIYPFTYSGLPQLLIIPVIRETKLWRLLIATWILFVMHIETV